MILSSASECDLHLGHYLHDNMDMLELIYIYVYMVSIQIIESGCALSHAQNSSLFSKNPVTDGFDLGNYISCNSTKNGPHIFCTCNGPRVLPLFYWCKMQNLIMTGFIFSLSHLEILIIIWL